VHLGVALLLVGAREAPAAGVTLKRLLARVRACVRGEVVRAAEGAATPAALEGLVACVDADVARELIRAAESSLTALHGARVRPLVPGHFARPVEVLPCRLRRHSRFHLDHGADLCVIRNMQLESTHRSF